MELERSEHMNFDLPIRIHWQLPDSVSEDLIESIRRCHPLAVTFEIEGMDQLTPLDLPWEGVLLEIIYRGWRTLGQKPVTGSARRWEFPIDGPVEAKRLVENSFLGVPPADAALRWFPRKGQMGELVPILEIAASTGCGLTLPNRPADVITSEGDRAFPDACELAGEIPARAKAFAQVLRSKKIRVHDFVLAKTLGLEGTEPHGCEAANSVVFIDRKERVYPCETLMIPMGDLNNEDLDAIWASPVRYRIRKTVAALPGLCQSCSDLSRCQGGCRGAVYHLNGHYNAPDPSCQVEDEDRYG